MMRQYEGSRTGNGDFKRVHEFLVKTGRADYTYGRFDWMMTNWDYLEEQYLDRIGIWEEDDDIVAVTLYDHSLDQIFPIVSQGYEYLYAEMIRYIQNHMVKVDDPDLMIFADESDFTLNTELEKAGFLQIDYKERVARFDLADDQTRKIPAPNLPEGCSFIDLAAEEDYEKYLYCLFQGFDHEAEGEVFSYGKAKEEETRNAYHRSDINLALKISIRDQEGNYLAHCGMWYDANSSLALIEPVCVIPGFRRLGLGREVVYEGLRRVKELGAKEAVVGSDQDFYYALGMQPYKTGIFWISPCPEST